MMSGAWRPLPRLGRQRDRLRDQERGADSWGEATGAEQERVTRSAVRCMPYPPRTAHAVRSGPVDQRQQRWRVPGPATAPTYRCRRRAAMANGAPSRSRVVRPQSRCRESDLPNRRGARQGRRTWGRIRGKTSAKPSVSSPPVARTSLSVYVQPGGRSGFERNSPSSSQKCRISVTSGRSSSGAIPSIALLAPGSRRIASTCGCTLG
jgi:hypothetical protein